MKAVSLFLAGAGCASAVLLFHPAALRAASAADPSDPLERGRAFTALFYEGRTDSLWEMFGGAMRAHMESRENLDAFRQKVALELGDEVAVLSENATQVGDNDVYSRLARFQDAPQAMEVLWAFDARGVVQGFVIRPPRKEADSAHLDYRTLTDLRLPFDGLWSVFWGGRTVAQNYHAESADQRFAVDFVVREDGSSHAGDGSANEQYHCFGRPILAPGAGVVVVAADGLPDNSPRKSQGMSALGNHVIFDHGNGEFSFLAHLRQGSVRVQRGDTLAAGDTVAACGNSGHSSEPHLHYHLQTTSVFQKGEGLPAQFRNYLADGEPVARGEPLKDQAVAATTPPR